MKKKDLTAVTTDLAALAGTMPTQHVQNDRTGEISNVRTRPDSKEGEVSVQFSFSLRKSLRRELARLAAEHDMTIRAFILESLRDRGLNVTDDDLRDMRKR